jgi:DMSO/TMAO reductase YedYZ molybdopterin-dependent catalytic subunit
MEPHPEHVEPDAAGRRTRPSGWRSALAGLTAAGVSIAVGELVAGASKRLSSPVITVGNRVVDAVPRQVKDLAIEWFGTNDKKALLIGIYSVVAVFGLVVGLLSARRHLIGAAGIAAFAGVGVWAAGQEVGAPWWAGAPSALGAVAGVGALGLLLAAIPHASHPAWAEPAIARLPWGRRASAEHGPDGDASGVEAAAGDPPAAPTPALPRRAFLQASAAVVVVGSAAAATGRWLQGRFSAASSRAAVVLPRAKRAAPPLADDASLDVAGISPFLTPNGSFYRIDTNLTVPQITVEEWSLRITGMVDDERTYSYEDILAMDLVEERITLTCVSNEVGGSLVGTATWLGVPLRSLLEAAGVRRGADQVVGRAFDGFTTGFPVEAATDGRPALLAVGMNGEPLPLAHGFPARLIVPGLYGYVSATKWVTELELTTFASFDAYWVRRDWSADGVIKTMSRIDTPRGLQRVKAGRVPIAGVAWAQTRGIERVEVRVDDGPWRPARLADQDSTLTWRQWRYDWDATPGRHQVTCRAVDGTGAAQTEERAKPFPDGASGWHSIAVLVD